MMRRDPWFGVNMAELRGEAKLHGLTGYSRMRRDELIAAIEEAKDCERVAAGRPETSEELRRPGPTPLLDSYRRRPRVKPTVEVIDGTYVATTSSGRRVEVTLVNPDTRRWQVRYEGPLNETKVREYDDRQLDSIIEIVLGPKQPGMAWKMKQRIRRDYP